ncbi:hypothetical protein IKG24_02075 [Candidatus Saccharibacteria bacterium]|nr:hypothetical protein [Candidatus Saccharibacteria bacterium]
MLEEKLLKSTVANLKIHAKALDIPAGSAEEFIKKSLKATEKVLKNRKVITEADFKRTLIKELKKYHQDLAYTYENYDKII